MTDPVVITVDELAAQIETVRLLDCRFNLMDPEAGRNAYQQGHLPGAHFADLDRDLAARVGERTGRHPLPSVEQWRHNLGRWGIAPELPVVVYDDRSGALAARAWWLLRYFGHTDVRLLDGGFDAWVAAGGMLEAGDAAPAAVADVQVTPSESMTITAEALIADGVLEGRVALADARDAARFAGKSEPIDRLAGHVPGALNLPFTDNLESDGGWASPEHIRGRWKALRGADGLSADAVMCGSGVTACHLVAACVRAGLPEPRLYVGSWSGWISDPERPVAAEP